MATNTPTKEASVEQIQYARILEKGMFAGLALMILAFALYVFGIMKPLIPLHDISSLWATKSGVYLTTVENKYIPEGHPLKAKIHAQQNAEASQNQGHDATSGEHHAHKQVLRGWTWVTLLGYADFLNFLPVAILAGITILCYMAIIPGLFARGDKAMGIMAVVEIVILVLAASGVLRVGGH